MCVAITLEFGKPGIKLVLIDFLSDIER